MPKLMIGPAGSRSTWQIIRFCFETCSRGEINFVLDVGAETMCLETHIDSYGFSFDSG